jgi:hypothetical protein
MFFYQDCVSCDDFSGCHRAKPRIPIGLNRNSALVWIYVGCHLSAVAQHKQRLDAVCGAVSGRQRALGVWTFQVLTPEQSAEQAYGVHVHLA